MSDHDDRTEIAAAINTVDGINCWPYYRQTARSGDAVVSWAGSTRSENGFGFMNRWQVMVILPQDHAAAERTMSDNLDHWVDALAPVLIVTSIEPAQLTLDAGMIPAVVIEGARARN